MKKQSVSLCFYNINMDSTSQLSSSLIYKADGEELLYANHAAVSMFGCDDLEDFKKLTGKGGRDAGTYR